MGSLDREQKSCVGGTQSDLIPVCRYGITNNMKIKKLSWPRESLASEFSEGPRCF